MGTSHFDSNVIAKDGVETIRGFATISASTVTGSNLVGTTKVHGVTVAGNTVAATTANIVKANITGTLTISDGKVIDLGKNLYILTGTCTTADNVEAVATALSASPGTLYISTAGKLYIMTAKDTAATVSV